MTAKAGEGQAPFDDLAGAYAWLDGHINYEKRLDRTPYDTETFALEDFRRRLVRLGNPQAGPRTVHIAGTRGKGSAALMLECLLRASGRRTAVFTSPHIREYRERIRIDGEALGAAEFVRLLGRIASVAPGERQTGGHRFKTVFENLTALFFLAAREAGVDWVVVETGLGGRLDATNVLPPGPVLLTRIGLEHTHLLGETLGEIAWEKAAILKKEGWGIAARQENEGESGIAPADEVFARRARETGAELEAAAEVCPLGKVEAHGEGLSVRVVFEGEELTVELPVYGPFQAENLQNALAMLASLRRRGLVGRTSHEAICKGLQTLRLPGRMEPVAREPLVLADAGHCPTAGRALAAAMTAHFGEAPATLVVGMMRDKRHPAFLEALGEYRGWRAAICYRPALERALAGERLAEAAEGLFPRVRVASDVGTALQMATKGADKGHRILATGSIYAIADLHDWGLGQDGNPQSAPLAATTVEQK